MDYPSSHEKLRSFLLRQYLKGLKGSGSSNIFLSVQKENYAGTVYQNAGFKVLDETNEEYRKIACF